MDETAAFRHLRHNDFLCPTAERQLNRYLDCFLKYQRVAYDVQGPRDRGTDLLLRYEVDNEDRFVVLQVKSYDDLKDREYLSRLKAQTFEIHAEYGARLAHCYIIVCTDANEHRSQLRNIKKEFATVSWATVVDPAYAWTFLHLSDIRIDAIVQAVLKENDAVYSEARKTIASLAPLEIAVLLCLVWLARDTRSREVQVEKLLDIGFLDQAMRSIPDIDRDSFFLDEEDAEDDTKSLLPQDRQRTAESRLAEALDVLSDEVIYSSAESGLVTLDLRFVEALEVVMLDAKVRFGYDGNELIRYVFDALDVPRTYNINFDLRAT
ncbi:MAG TPA: hypothetical protein VFU86_15580 [Terriglobales bacterium]|nr:hypothetical protein [Terriglobales bacterium]